MSKVTTVRFDDSDLQCIEFIKTTFYDELALDLSDSSIVKSSLLFYSRALKKDPELVFKGAT